MALSPKGAANDGRGTPRSVRRASPPRSPLMWGDRGDLRRAAVNLAPEMLKRGVRLLAHREGRACVKALRRGKGLVRLRSLVEDDAVNVVQLDRRSAAARAGRVGEQPVVERDDVGAREGRLKQRPRRCWG